MCECIIARSIRYVRCALQITTGRATSMQLSAGQGCALQSDLQSQRVGVIPGCRITGRSPGDPLLPRLVTLPLLKSVPPSSVSNAQLFHCGTQQSEEPLLHVGTWQQCGPEVQSMKVAAPRNGHMPHSALPRLEPCVLSLDHPHGKGVLRDVSRLHPGRTGGSFAYAHVLSHMSEMGGAGISAL
jgi:hypothetical protein